MGEESISGRPVEIYKNNSANVDIKSYINTLKKSISKKTDSFTLVTDKSVISQNHIIIPLEIIDTNVIELETIRKVFLNHSEVEVQIIDNEFYVQVILDRFKKFDYSLICIVLNIIVNCIYIMNYYVYKLNS